MRINFIAPVVLHALHFLSSIYQNKQLSFIVNTVIPCHWTVTISDFWIIRCFSSLICLSDLFAQLLIAKYNTKRNFWRDHRSRKKKFVDNSFIHSNPLESIENLKMFQVHKGVNTYDPVKMISDSTSSKFEEIKMYFCKMAVKNTCPCAVLSPAHV